MYTQKLDCNFRGQSEAQAQAHAQGQGQAPQGLPNIYEISHAFSNAFATLNQFINF